MDPNFFDHRGPVPSLPASDRARQVFQSTVVKPMLDVANVYRNEAARAFADGKDDHARELRAKAQEIEALANSLPFVELVRVRG